MRRISSTYSDFSPVGDHAPEPPSVPLEVKSSGTVFWSAALVWLPHLVTYCWVWRESFSKDPMQMFSVVSVGFLVMLITVLVATRFDGDWLMLLAVCVGLLCELAGIGVAFEPKHDGFYNVWSVVSVVHGIIAGVLCRSKDVEDNRYFEYHTIGERLYVVVPFTVGQWLGFVYMKGLVNGLIRAFGSIFMCLATVGYGVVAYRVGLYFGVFQEDLIGLVAKLFTTGFGVVLAGLAVSIFAVTYLAIPFMKTLLSLNAFISSVGIIFEVLVYENNGFQSDCERAEIPKE